MSYNIVTVSRQFGSGGRSIAKAVAERLGYEYYDNELVCQIAKESGFSEDFIREAGEYAGYKSSLLFSLATGSMSSGNGMSTTDSLYVFQHNFIKELGKKGKCVIVGRCADYILKDRDDCFNVFIHASMDFRADRIVRLYGEREDSPEKRLADKDKKRMNYYKHYTYRRWGDAPNYHLCLDSGAIGIDKCVDIITDLTK